MSTVWTIFQGEAGTRTGRLSDASGYVDLSQFDSVSVVVAKTAGTTPVIDEFVTIDPDQITNPGLFSFTFDSTVTNIPIRTQGYLLSFRCIDGLNTIYFPLDRRSERTYGKFVVNDPLG